METPILEETFNLTSKREWVGKTWSNAILLSATYVLFVLYIGPYWMRNRPALKLKGPLIIWNSVLAVFSAFGVLIMWPEFVSTFQNFGFRGSYCRIGGLFDGVLGYWHYLFVLSKAFEFGDTVFLVLRKRPVIFLHWFHHVLTFLYAWYSFTSPQAVYRWGVFMNVFVHSVMYTYYAIRAAGFRMPRFVSMGITGIQILQFVVGSFICSHAFYINVLQGKNQWPNGCDVDYLVCIWQMIMYLFYLYLFVEFFHNSYFVKNAKSE